jgi:hypothetical protein
MLEHVLGLGKIEVLSARARYQAPNARALLIIDHIYVKSNSLIKTHNRVIALFFIFIFFLNSIY